MALRSDFKIHAMTPEAPVEEPMGTTATVGSVFGYETLPGRHKILSIVDVAEVSPPEQVKEAPHVPRIAVLVTHGMGQQVPFETLSAIGQALITEHMRPADEWLQKESARARDDLKKRSKEPAVENGRRKGDIPPPPATPPEVNVRRVRLTRAQGAPELSRAEVHFASCDGRPIDVHVYESYWAPLTEGQISFPESVGFLFSAGWNGIKSYLSLGYRGVSGKRPGFGHFDRWIFGDFQPMRIKGGTFLGLVWAMLSAIVFLAPALLLFTPFGLDACKVIYAKYKTEFFTSDHWVQALTILGVLVFAVIAYWAHYFMVEFVGDVAIYVSSFKVSRFDEIRNKILDAAKSVSQQIYLAGILDDHEQPYDAVVIVGHSLGSVISYDLLNAAINWDQVENEFAYKVVERTRRLITFGSPLDKTAFLFRTQVGSNRNLREALAARQQPLILDYRQFRPAGFQWVNIYSPMDFVSGHLDYYDVPDDEDCNPVVNVIDWRAWIPGLAHVQYWGNAKLHETLYAAVCESAVAVGAPVGAASSAGARSS